jgi:predicted ATP-grasp superfamily ATP-dependent carboligase
LGELVRNHHIDILLPMTELTTALLLKNESAFPGTVLPFPDMETIDSLANKCTLMRMAEVLGIPIPDTWYADNPESLPVGLEELNYPLVLKPGRSWLHQQGKWERVAVRVVQNPSEAMEILRSEPAFRLHPFMLQEYIEGSGAGIFALYDHGNPLAFFAHRRLREKPPEGGVSVLSESIPVDSALRSQARALLDKANWHGVAMIEFKIAPNGTPYLMEINTRFWGSLQLAVDAGVDFPWLLYQLACDSQPDPVDDYKVGVRLRWLLGDLDNLYLTLRDTRYSFREKLDSIRHFLTPSPFRTRHEVDRWNDLGPSWYELKAYVRDLF